MRFMSMAAAMAVAAVANGAYDIGSDMEGEAFWKSDPVIFVQRHSDAGFQFTSDQRDGADSRTDGGVAYHGIPVFESRVSFAEGGGIARVELLLFNNGGTETMREYTDESGKKFRRRERIDKTMSRDEFFAMLDKVRGKLTAAGATWPLHHDPADSNLRLAPTYPAVGELAQAMELFCLAVKLAAVERLIIA